MSTPLHLSAWHHQTEGGEGDKVVRVRGDKGEVNEVVRVVMKVKGEVVMREGVTRVRW